MSDKMREEFEAEVIRDSGKHGMLCDLTKDSSGRYRSACERSAWWAWQASRAALAIELPAENPLGSGPGDCGDGRPSFEQHCAAECNFILRDCREAIEAVGVKVKP